METPLIAKKLQRTDGKLYMNLFHLAQDGFRLSWNLERQIIDVSVQELDKHNGGTQFGVYKAEMLWSPDKRLGKVRGIFHYDKNWKDLYLEYSPEFLRWGRNEELPRKNIALQRSGEIGENLKLPYRFYLLREG